MRHAPRIGLAKANREQSSHDFWVNRFVRPGPARIRGRHSARLPLLLIICFALLLLWCRSVLAADKAIAPYLLNIVILDKSGSMADASLRWPKRKLSTRPNKCRRPSPRLGLSFPLTRGFTKYRNF